MLIQTDEAGTSWDIVYRDKSIGHISVRSLRTHKNSPSNNYASLWNFTIANEYRGKGHGKKHLKDILEVLKNKGIKTVELSVDKENDVALSLYSKLNFKIVETFDYSYAMQLTF